MRTRVLSNIEIKYATIKTGKLLGLYLQALGLINQLSENKIIVESVRKDDLKSVKNFVKELGDSEVIIKNEIQVPYMRY